MQWNIRSFRNNKNFIRRAIDDLSPTVICMQETRCKVDQDIRLPGFSCAARSDREESTGGGTAILIANDIPVTNLNIDSELETSMAQALINNQKLSIVNIYIPPSTNNNCIAGEMDKIIAGLCPPFILCMDSNGHHTSWGSEANDRRGEIIDEWVTDNDVVLLNDGSPTYETNNGNYTHIDLTITSPDIAAQLNWEVACENYNSDHYPVCIRTNIEIDGKQKLPRYIFERADWGKYNNLVKLPTVFETPSQVYEAVVTNIIKAADIAIPKTSPNLRTNLSKFFWNKDCAIAKREKSKAMKAYKKNRGNLNLWIKYKAARAKFRYTMKLAKKNSWNDFVKSISTNTPSTVVWKRVKLLNNNRSYKAIVLKEGDTLISEKTEVAEKFAENFTSRGGLNVPDRQISPVQFNRGNSEWYNKPFEIGELKRALNNTKTTSPGPDGISYDLITKLNPEKQCQLLEIFNYFWHSNIPDQWKQSITIPIYKHGKHPSSPDSYRPISLTNCLCKVFERMAALRLRKFLETNQLIDPNQCGFRPGFSTYDPICKLEKDIRTAFIERKSTLAVFIDIAQAYDTVWHEGLLQKIKALGLEGNLPLFIQNFISNRSTMTRIDTVLSSPHFSDRGVPQGSVISPLLFLIMINDITKQLGPTIQHSLFADDCAIWVTSKDHLENHNNMQAALKTITDWTQKWQLSISTAKTKAVYFSYGTKNPPPLKLLNDEIEYVTKMRYLGVLFDRRLTWKHHIEHVKEKCNGDIRLLRVISHQGWGADAETMRNLYRTLTLPKITYASFIYSTASKTNLTKLDRIQYAASRIILGALKCTITEKLEIACDLMPLEIKRKEEMMLYTNRVLGNFNHPLRRQILEYPPNLHGYQSRPLPVIGRTMKELYHMELCPNTVSSMDYSLKLTTRNLKINDSLSKQKKDQLNDFIWRILFKNLEKEYDHCEKIFTDGSKQGEGAGAAVWSTKFNIMARLPPECSILTCELFAIYSAVLFIRGSGKETAIFTDSMSSIQSLKLHYNSKHPLIHKIAEEIENNEKTIHLIWVPSHVGIPGNCHADELAKKTLSLGTITKINLPNPDVKRIIKQYYKEQWRTKWTASSSHYGIKGFSPGKLPSYFKLPRRKQIKMSRIILQTTMLTHKHYFTRDPRPICDQCSSHNNLDHIVTECPKYEQFRNDIRSYCLDKNIVCNIGNLANCERPPNLLLNFFEQAQLLDQI